MIMVRLHDIQVNKGDYFFEPSGNCEDKRLSNVTLIHLLNIRFVFFSANQNILLALIYNT